MANRPENVETSTFPLCGRAEVSSNQITGENTIRLNTYVNETQRKHNDTDNIEVLLPIWSTLVKVTCVSSRTERPTFAKKKSHQRRRTPIFENRGDLLPTSPVYFKQRKPQKLVHQLAVMGQKLLLLFFEALERPLEI